jgi:hypothetical protein
VLAFVYAWGIAGPQSVHRFALKLHWPSVILTDWVIGDGKGYRLRHEFFLNVSLQFALLFCVAISVVGLLAAFRGRRTPQ